MRIEPISDLSPAGLHDRRPTFGPLAVVAGGAQAAGGAVAGWLARLWMAVWRGYRRRLEAEHLRDFTDAQLRDIGLRRGEIETMLRTGRPVPPV